MRVGIVGVGGARRRAVLLAVASCVLGLWAPAAWAGKGVVGVFGSPGSGDGQFAAYAGATAINLASGDVYVVDEFGYRVERFDAGGSFLGAFGWGVADGSYMAQTCTFGCQGGLAGSGDGQFDTPQGIAIDQSDGSVYVVDGNNNRVEKFDGSGAYLSQFGSAGSAEGQLSGPQGIAVDPTDGSVYVADTGNNRVVKFDSAGGFVSTFGFGVADGNNAFETCSSSCQPGLAVTDDGGFNFPTRVAVDSSGQVYVLDAGNGRIERYTSANAYDQLFDPTDVNPGTFPFEIAVGPGNDHLYVAQAAPDYSELRVVEIDPTGTYVDTHGVGAGVFNPSGLALTAGSQRIYLADGFAARVLILDDVIPPEVTIDPASAVTSTSATLSGTVDPNGNPDVGWHFEISTDDVNWTPTAADQDPGSGTAPVPVSQDLTNLAPSTTYYARLVAKRIYNAPAISSEVQFTTDAIAPDVTTGVADDVTPDHAVLTGLVNPHHNETTYYFEWGTDTSYGNSVPVTQDADAGSANYVSQVLQRIDGLAAGTTYHYRLVAANQAGTAEGADQTFTTTTPPPPSTSRPGAPGSGFLPDNRGWEKVSPNDKGGADVIADNQRARVAADGNAANYALLGGVDHLGVRGSGHWITHAITPEQQPTSGPGLQSRYVGSFSGDVSTGVFLAATPLTDDPNVANVPNIYLRNDLKTDGAGFYQLLSSCPLCESTGTPLPPLPALPPQVLATGIGAPFIAGASADFGHVIFESQQQLTADAPSCTNIRFVSQCPGKLYEWDHGALRLAGVLPDGTPAYGSSQAGQGAGGSRGATELTPHTISADGSRIFFTVPPFPGARDGALYVRVDHAVTVQLNATERTDCADHDPCFGVPEPDPSGPQPARYWDASTDGTRVFFSTGEALTEDAPTDWHNKLYMYDASASYGRHLTLLSTDTEPSDTGDVIAVQGASADGHYVYFSAAGQLVAGQPYLDTSPALYVWHDGSVRYIATLAPDDLDEDTNTVNWQSGRTSVRVTPDGSRLLFRSTADRGPTGYQQNGNPQFYVYSYASGSLSCVSCDPSGAPATAGAFTTVRANTGGAATTSAQPRPLSDDGRYALFSSGQPLVPQDVNGKVDVYAYDALTGTVHLITSGAGGADSYFMNASSSGRDAFFATRQRLVRSDADGRYDLYDARVGGG
jgi:sugar lactone lactonase YvrE